MVRIQRRVSRKRYLKSKRVYEYERMSLGIPRKYHDVIRPFTERDLDLTIVFEKDSLVITLTPVKMFRHVANTPQEICVEYSVEA